MILQALVRRYEDLTARDLIAPLGWDPVGVSCALELDEQGWLFRPASIQENVEEGNKTVLTPRRIDLPEDTVCLHSSQAVYQDLLSDPCQRWTV